MKLIFGISKVWNKELDIIWSLRKQQKKFIVRSSWIKTLKLYYHLLRLRLKINLHKINPQLVISKIFLLWLKSNSNYLKVKMDPIILSELITFLKKILKMLILKTLDLIPLTGI